jgi:hypothetical protein
MNKVNENAPNISIHIHYFYFITSHRVCKKCYLLVIYSKCIVEKSVITWQFACLSLCFLACFVVIMCVLYLMFILLNNQYTEFPTIMIATYTLKNSTLAAIFLMQRAIIVLFTMNIHYKLHFIMLRNNR